MSKKIYLIAFLTLSLVSGFFPGGLVQEAKADLNADSVSNEICVHTQGNHGTLTTSNTYLNTYDSTNRLLQHKPLFYHGENSHDCYNFTAGQEDYYFTLSLEPAQSKPDRWGIDWYFVNSGGPRIVTAGAHLCLGNNNQVDAYGNRCNTLETPRTIRSAGCSSPVTLWEHPNYGGVCLNLPANTNLDLTTTNNVFEWGPDSWNDKASSIKVASSYTAKLYENNNTSTTPATYTANNSDLGSKGDWASYASVTQSNPLTITGPTPPSQTVQAGDRPNFSVAASGGTQPYSYEWRKDSSTLASCLSASCNIQTTTSDGGRTFSIDVIVTDADRNAVSGNATLRVNASSSSLTVSVAPPTKTVTAPAEATFNATATGGTGTYTYAWRKGNSQTVLGTNATFTISPTAASDSGTYYVTAKDSGSPQSTGIASATLTVNGAGGGGASQSCNADVCIYENASFNPDANGNPYSGPGSYLSLNYASAPDSTNHGYPNLDNYVCSPDTTCNHGSGTNKWGDELSSIIVKDGYSAILYEDINYGGASYTITSSSGDAAQHFSPNDHISSIKIVQTSSGGGGGGSQCPSGKVGTSPNCCDSGKHYDSSAKRCVEDPLPSAGPQPPNNITNPTAIASIEEAIGSLTFWLYVFAVPLLSLMILYGAFLIMTSGGEEERYSTGMRTIRWGVIGFLVILVAGAIAAFVRSVLG